MRITFLSPPPNLTGGQRVISVYAKKLANRGHIVEVVCYRPKKKSFRRKVRLFLGGNGWTRSPELKESHYKNYGVPFRVVKHNGPLKNNDILPGDVIIATFWPTAYQAFSMNVERGTPVYLVQHDEGVVWHKEADNTYNLPMLQVCVSNWVANSIRSRHPDANQIIINNAVEYEQFKRGPIFEKRPIRFGFMYSTRNWKRSDLVIEALKIARKENEFISVIAIGEKFDRNMPPWINKMQRPDSDAISNAYGKCRAWLFSSDIEGFGLPVLESMACGTPVIGTPAGAAPELIEKGGGILVPFNDPEAMAEAILQVCQFSREHWQAMSDAAYKTAISYSWDNATDLLESTLICVSKSRPVKTK